MEHKINIAQLHSPQANEMAHAISTCVHCGFCLPACPTYHVLGEEMDSPRGRIILMRGVLEGELPLAEATPYLDRCLGCLGCETACPSGVPYGELISSFRAHTEEKRSRPVAHQLARKMAAQSLPFARRFRIAAWMGRIAKPFQRLFPGPIAAMLGLVPHRLPQQVELPEFTPAKGTRRGTVGLLVGCVQQVIAPEINTSTIQVLSMNGYDVVVPKNQSCCGALGMHTGNANQAKRLAHLNFDLFADDLEAIITNAAGCGSGIKEYDLLFRGDSRHDAATRFSSRVMDISEFLSSREFIAPKPLKREMRVAYHDACHLAHAQKITAAPRKLLAQVPGLQVLEIPDGEICCGSAGTYNIEQPEIAATLGQTKALNIRSLNVDAVVMGNIGCMVQLDKYLNQTSGKEPPLRVLHTVQLLAEAYGTI